MATTNKTTTNSHPSATPHVDGIEPLTAQMIDEMDGNVETVHDCAQSTSDRKSVSDAVDINALIAESMPDADTDQVQLVAFITRQYDGYLFVGKQNSVFQKRIGDVLIRLKEVLPHGEWQDFIKETFPFTPRSATNYMRLASTTTVEEARTTALTELYQEKGIIPYRKDRPTQPASPDDGDLEDDKGMADIQAVGNVVKKVTSTARHLWERIEALPPESYNSAERHGAFLKGFSSDIEGAVMNLYRTVVRLVELARAANEGALADAVGDLQRLQSTLSALEDNVSALATDAAQDDVRFVLTFTCHDCGCAEEFAGEDESHVLQDFANRRVHDWMIEDDTALCPDCQNTRHDREVSREEVA